MAAFQNVKGAWRATSSTVREALTRELVHAIVPTYSDFFRSYSNEQFSKKHMSDYLVYSPQNAEKIFVNFFDS